ncbi:MAG: SRPBCC family protein, partial [Planctomycetia bacterium]
FGTPLVMGMVAGFLYNRPVVKTTRATLRIGGLVMLLSGGVLLAFALEGLICLVMAAPIVMPTAMAGALLGKWIAEATSAGLVQMVPVILALPLLSGAESLVTSLPEYEVLTTVEIDAPPAAVWRHVVAFPDLPEPEDWFFRSGIACPLRARIEGTGVGAVRPCEFTTGDFVEPITVWDEPRRLAFDVREQPDPMVELSPWRHVHPPHLRDRSLESRRGEFRLIDLGDGRTRLEGRTWYTFSMRPQAYWTLWSELSIHKIHRRVLEHIKTLSERDSRPHRATARSGDTGTG